MIKRPSKYIGKGINIAFSKKYRIRRELEATFKEQRLKIDEISSSDNLIELKKEKIYNETIDIVLKQMNIDIEDVNKVFDCNKEFLKNSITEWDNIDKFTLIILAILIITAETSTDSSKLNKIGKKAHKSHSGKAKRKKVNRFHWKTKMDKLPWRKQPGGSSKQFRKSKHMQRPLSKFQKFFSRGLKDSTTLKFEVNHRYLFGHDWSKIWEMFSIENYKFMKDENQIKFGIIGYVLKVFWHMFYDSCSEKGIPKAGATYFLQFMNCEKEIQEYFTVHIEDIFLAKGINGVVYFYFRIRSLIEYSQTNSKTNDLKNAIKSINLKDVIKVVNESLSIDIKERPFKEYEMSLYLNALIIALQFSTLSGFRGKINFSSINSYISNLVQYLKKSNLYNKELDKEFFMILNEIKGEL